MKLLKIGLLAAALAMNLSAPATAQDKMAEHRHMMTGSDNKTHADMMDMHQKMAGMHKKMSECLKAKSMKECHAEMKNECQGMMKTCPMMNDNYCPMMDKMTDPETK